MKTIIIGNLTCDFLDAGSGNIVYILVPMRLDTQDVSKITQKYKINIVVVSGMDWNNDMTPWSAPGIKSDDPDFGNDSEKFLNDLINNVIPDVESHISSDLANRILIGVSLSGLFALWSWIKTSDFSSVGCLSGSFWYDGFSDWFCKQLIINPKGKVYLSLGDKEAKSSSSRFGTVNNKTIIIEDYLQRNNINVHLEYDPGNHFSPIIPRIDKALSFLV